MSSAVFADGASTVDESKLAEQRSLFVAVYPDAERGNWTPADNGRELLADYVLWPDLRAAYLKARISTADHREIEAFLDQYGMLKPARELRYRFALHLIEQNRLGEFLGIYERFYQGLDIARLDCVALSAEIEAGRDDRIVSRALELWMTGQSQVDECDPVFDLLRSRGQLGAEHYAARFDLAIESKEFGLARYLSKQLEPGYREIAERWLEARDDPRGFIDASAALADTPLAREQLAYAVMRIAYADPPGAHDKWQSIERRYGFEPATTAEVERHIALWSARNHRPEAGQLLAALPSAAASIETARWQVRSALLQHDWAAVIHNVDSLPDDEAQKAEWQYWKAVALGENGDEASARPIFASLAADRGYHGFLAADAIGEPYAVGGEPLASDPALSTEVEQDPAIIRARELFFVGLEGRGRSEWDAAVALMTGEQQLQAALLAHRWGWHSRAIATVATAGRFDDLEIRYPLPWRQDFSAAAESAGIADSWAYGIARSESLFMRDIRSSAGAVGVMQLMPATGRQTAREIRMPYAGLATLTDSTSNIRLGTWYLGRMFSRFEQNRVLATAAYNAGPHRVDAWMPDSGSLDARIWIANIPYNETRSYVRRVLADEAIFHWRLTRQLRRLSSELPEITAAVSAAAPAD